MDFEFTVLYTQIILTLMLVNIKIARKKKLLEMCLLFRFGLEICKTVLSWKAINNFNQKVRLCISMTIRKQT